jgi:hypothetical protein
MLESINAVGIYLLSAQTQGDASCPAGVKKEEKELMSLSRENPHRHGRRVNANVLAEWRTKINKSASGLADRAADCRQLAPDKKEAALIQAATAIIVALGNEKNLLARLGTLNNLLHIAEKMAAAGVSSKTVNNTLETADCMVDILSAQKASNIRSFRERIVQIKESIKVPR